MNSISHWRNRASESLRTALNRAKQVRREDLRSSAVELGRSAADYARRTPGALRSAALNTPANFRSAITALKAYFQSLAVNPDTRYHTVLWSIVVVFVGFFGLAGSSPYNLLIPFVGFEHPSRDGREVVQIYGANRSGQGLVPMERPFYRDGDAEGELRRLATLIALPQEVGVQDRSLAYSDVEPLPDFGQAIRKIWRLPAGGKTRVIVDLRRETIEQELAEFLLSRRDAAEQRLLFMDEFFTAYTASIFRYSADASSVEFLLDGKRESIEGMRFDLAKRYLRGSIAAGQ